MKIVNLLAKLGLHDAIMRYAFDVKYVDKDERAKLEYRFSCKGKRYFKHIKPDFIPLTRWNEIDTRVMEMQARINRETLQEFSKTTRVAAEKGDLITVARLMGELEERVNLLYDPHALLRIITALYIREDQIESAGVWNDEIEDAKFEDIKSELVHGGLSFFLISQDLETVLTFSDTSNGDSKIFEKGVLKNQTKQVELFDKLLKRIREQGSGEG